MAIAVVQTESNASEDAADTTLVLTLSAALTAGNGVALLVGWQGQAQTITGISGGGTYDTIISKYNDTASRDRSLQGFFLKNASASSTITITFSGAVAFRTATAIEVSGHDTGTQADATATGRTQTGIGGATDAVATNSLTTVSDGALVVGLAVCIQGGTFTSLDAGTGMTAAEVNPVNAARHRAAYILKATAGSQNVLFTATGATSSEFASIAFSIKPAAAGSSIAAISNYYRMLRRA